MDGYKDDGIKSACQVLSSDKNRTWRLVQVKDDEAEEAVLCVQGVICSKTMPPIKYPFHM